MNPITPEVLDNINTFRGVNKSRAEIQNVPNGVFVYLPNLPDHKSVTLIFRDHGPDLQTCLAAISRNGNPTKTATVYFKNARLMTEKDRIVIADKTNWLIISPAKITSSKPSDR